MIEVLVGMIASGKSTYARKRAKEGAVIVNDDAIVQAVHGGDYTLYDKANKPLYKSVENHVVTTAVAMGKDVVIDRGVDVRRSSRRRWVALADALDVSCVAVAFQKAAPIAHASRRFHSDNRGHNLAYWLAVAKSHNADYSEPTIAEGFASIHYPPSLSIAA